MKKGPQLAFKVVSVVRTDDGRTLYTSIHPSFRRIYEVGIFYTDGPFLLFADLDSAQKFAQSLIHGVPHLAILQAQCTPIEPRPKYLPAWYSLALERIQWRSLVVQNVHAADEFLLIKGIAEPLPHSEILAFQFRLFGEPVAVFERKLEIQHEEVIVDD